MVLFDNGFLISIGLSPYYGGTVLIGDSHIVAHVMVVLSEPTVIFHMGGCLIIQPPAKYMVSICTRHHHVLC